MSRRVYVYRCATCANIREVINTEDRPRCEACRTEMKRKYTPPNVGFKGGGFTRSTGG